MDKFILINSSLNLKEFSDYFFSLVDIIDYHNRDSENVLGGNYFMGDKNGVAVDVQYNFYEELTEYKYIILMEPNFINGNPAKLSEVTVLQEISIQTLIKEYTLPFAIIENDTNFVQYKKGVIFSESEFKF